MIDLFSTPAHRYRVILLLASVRDWIAESVDIVRSVLRAVRSTGTYGSEMRLHALTFVIAAWYLLPFPSNSPLRALGRDIPKESWGLGMLAVAIYGLAMMLATRGNLLANESGRARALWWECLCYTFVSFIYIVTSYPRVGTAIFPFIALMAGGLYMRLSKQGPR